MRLRRISVMMPFDDPATPVNAVLPVVHRWVDEGRLGRFPVDVVQCIDAPEGRGIRLSGFEGDLMLERSGGVPTLRYTLKCAEDGEPAQHVVLALGRLLEAAGRLEADSGVRVDRSSVTVRIADRLNAPNTDEVRHRLHAEVVSAVTSTLGFTAPDIIGGSLDPRDPLSWTLRETTASPVAA